jgi:predicted ATP-binding protein involved in virulence
LLQRELPEALSRVFPKIQFIATTHSPIPLLGAPKESVILTVSRNIDAGITIERLDDQINFANLLPNTILSSPIFGFEDIIPSSNTNISDISTASDFASAEKLDEIKNTLNLKKIDFDAIDTDLKQKHNLRSDELRSNESSGEGMLET